MSLEDKLNKAVGEWKEHCSKPEVLASSSSSKVRCDAYRKIVGMSGKALPLIRKLYDAPDKNDFPLQVLKSYLVSAVIEIVGNDFSVPKELSGYVEKLEVYTKKWLDQNMTRYS